MDKRAHIIITGRVQKAGFRELVDETAFGLNLRGIVKNQDDGTVEIIVEGPQERLEELARRISIQRYPIRVDGMKMELSGPTGEFKEFTIIRDDRLDSDLNGKLDIGIMYLRDISSKQDRSLEKHDASLGKQDTMLAKQDAMLEKQDTMIEKQDAMLDKQDAMLGKQDAMLEKQDTMIQKQDETLTAIKTVDSHIERMDSNMAGHFARLDGKYGEFGDTMKGMASDIKAIRTDTASNRKRTDPV